jgi:hypothetical protein
MANDLMIWPLKLSPTGSPVATLSPNNFNTVSICFFKQTLFARFWRQSRLLAIFHKQTNKSLQRIFHVCNHTLLLEYYGLFYSDTAACNYGFADSIGWMCN